MAASGIRKHVSLKWRALALTSLVLLGLALLITWISKSSLSRQFQQAQHTIYEHQQQEIRLALQRSADVLKQLASVTAASKEFGHALSMNDVTAVSRALASQWPTMQLDAGIDDLAVFDVAGHQLAGYGQKQGVDNIRPDKAWVMAVIASEQPRTTLICWWDCRQYAAVPVLVNGSNAGVVMVSRSLAEVTRYIQRSSGNDIALIVRGPEQYAAMHDGHFLSDWQASLMALTHEQRTLPILKAASRRIDAVRLLQTPQQFNLDARQYELSALALNDRTTGYTKHRGYFVLVADVTRQLTQIHRTTRMALLIALAGWLVAEILLLFILWRPMARLRKLSRVLPRLARGEFDTVRQYVQASSHRYMDEIDVLENATRNLAHQLEALQEEVRSRGDQLELRISELAGERDFVSGLLDTAQVLIVTHDDRGRITLANRYCCMLTGLSEAKLQDCLFASVFMADSQHWRRPAETEQQESVMWDADGQPRTVIWYHTPLKLQGRNRSALISVGLDITERKLAEQQLAWLAHCDPLTELYNRRFFENALAGAVMPDASGAVLYLDLDRFKEVNELGGHHSGDQLLRLVAHALQSEIEDPGIIARLGGDEFAILLEHAGAGVAIRTAEQLIQALEQIVLAVDGRQHRAVASIGIALYPSHGQTPNELMANADFAMYKAKEDSAQRWHLLSAVQTSREELHQRVYWVECVRSALLEDRFELWAQPIVRLKDGSSKHYELLLRMRDEKGELVSPGVFIPIAERSGQIVALDRWVLRHGLQLLRRIQDRAVSLAINLSGQSLHDAGLEDFLVKEFEHSGANPGQLIIEVTETTAVTDFATARGVLEGVRALGCAVALDDFGVGFSSFHYLGQLPADYIKIDGSFIQTLPENEGNQLIVKAIADIAAGFGKATIAEFVDRQEILPILENYDIDYVQGYHMGKPEPASNVLW